MKALNLLIKPVSGHCNMRCSYCFYRDEAKNRSCQDFGVMTTKTAEKLIKNALEESEERVDFAFQGGEPTLAGLQFFQEFLELVDYYNSRRLPVTYSIQTNGLLLDDEWCHFLKENHFLVGLSMDGYEPLHDSHRVDQRGAGTYFQVRAAAERMRQIGVDFNILCVVTNRIAKRGAAVYNWFRDEGFRYLQFIPCLNPLGRTPIPGNDSVTADNYGSFLNNVFDRWYDDYIHGCYVSIRAFDNWVGMLLGRPPETCSMAGCCTVYGCIEADGSVYPCDFYVLDEWRLGNVAQDSFSSMLQSDRAREFVCRSQKHPTECLSCPYRQLCRGGCHRNREQGKNELCNAYKSFFAHSSRRLLDIALHQ